MCRSGWGGWERWGSDERMDGVVVGVVDIVGVVDGWLVVVVVGQ